MIRNKSKFKKINNKPLLKVRTVNGKPAALKSAAAVSMHTYAILMLSIICAICMAEEVFPEAILSARSGGYILTEKTFIFISVMLLILAVFVGVVAECRCKVRILLRYGVPLVYFAALVYYAYRNMEDLQEGVCYLSRTVMEAVNSYYKTNFTVYAGDWSCADKTLGFIVLCVGVFFLTEALWCAKRILLAGIPILVLAGEMAVGKTPMARGVVLLFLVVLLSEIGGWEDSRDTAGRVEPFKLWQRILSVLVPVGLLAACLVAGQIVLQEPAAQIASYGVTVRQMQWDMEENLKNQANKLLAGFQRSDWSHITNRSPNYTDTQVLLATFENMPGENVYLRGYYGTYYEDGQWSSGEDEFDVLWEGQAGEESVVPYVSCQDNPFIGYEYTLSLDYTDFRTTAVYVPPGLKADSLSDDITLTGDYMALKQKKISGVTYKYVILDLSLFFVEQPNEDYVSQDIAEWYSSYVRETYLDVPDSLSAQAEKIANEILKDTQGALTGSGWVSEDEYSLAETIALESEDEWDNDVKYYLATLVADYMSDWTYSLELSGVSDGSDVVAYFMKESHTGYCVHYATAAVMILRKLGVPARYAAGYLCRSDNAVMNENGEYEVSILDSDAHAWVEIYLEGIGWYPIEVTPTVGELPQIINTTSESQPVSESEDSETEAESEGAPETQEPESDSSQNQDDSESEQAGQENQSESSGNPDVQDGQLQASSSGNESFVRIARIIAIFMGILLIAAAAVTVIILFFIVLPRRREKMKLAMIRRDIRDGKKRRAVYAVHRMIFRKLRRKAHKPLGRISDAGYLALLEQYFPQEEPFAWQKYVEIVQKCVFSKENVTEEEARYCEGILLKFVKSEK